GDGLDVAEDLGDLSTLLITDAGILRQRPCQGAARNLATDWLAAVVARALPDAADVQATGVAQRRDDQLDARVLIDGDIGRDMQSHQDARDPRPVRRLFLVTCDPAHDAHGLIAQGHFRTFTDAGQTIAEAVEDADTL